MPPWVWSLILILSLGLGLRIKKIFLFLCWGSVHCFSNSPQACWQGKANCVAKLPDQINIFILFIMNEKIITTVEQISALRKNAGQSEKRIKNSAQEFISIPESGTFDKVGEKEFDIPGVGIRKSIGLYLVGGGFISENALNAQKLLKELTKVKNGERKDKFILKSSRLSDLSKHGNSADQRLLNLQGKSFTTQKQVDCIVYKSAALEKFDTVVVTTDTPANLEKVLKQTETKDLYKFEIE